MNDDYVRAVLKAGRDLGVTARGIVIAFATVFVESDWLNYANYKVPDSLKLPHDAIGSDGYSVGLFQQQVVMGNGWWWGDAATCMSPYKSAMLFFQRLKNLDYNSTANSPGSYAQTVQESAFPDRYDERMADAQELYDRITNQTPEQDSTMAERVLPYDRTVVPQETGYWCGPAATQVILNTRGIFVNESDLARQIGTTTAGTDYVGLIERALDQRIPDAQYTSVYIETDPPTQKQKDQLWANIVNSINAGYGVVMNWVAPPSNYPRGVKGSVSPAYRGGTVFHYVACMGYDDNPAARAVWIADSGFQPQGYWISFDQCATLIPPKGYCYAAVAPAAQPNPPAPVGPTPVGPADDQLTLRWNMLGGQTLVEAVAEIRDHLLGTEDRKKQGAL